MKHIVYKVLGIGVPMKIGRWVIIGAICIVGAFFAGRYSNPTKEIVRIETVEVESKSRDIEVTRSQKVTESPDGTKVTEFETKEREITKSDTSKKLDSEKVVEFDRAQWSIGVYGSAGDRIAATLDRRIIGNVYAGLYGSINRHDSRDYDYGVGLRIEF